MLKARLYLHVYKKEQEEISTILFYPKSHFLIKSFVSCHEGVRVLLWIKMFKF
jgi:hypothetical protein